jgi:hypothetical protein
MYAAPHILLVKGSRSPAAEAVHAAFVGVPDVRPPLRAVPAHRLPPRFAQQALGALVDEHPTHVQVRHGQGLRNRIESSFQKIDSSFFGGGANHGRYADAECGYECRCRQPAPPGVGQNRQQGCDWNQNRHIQMSLHARSSSRNFRLPINRRVLRNTLVCCATKSAKRFDPRQFCLPPAYGVPIRCDVQPSMQPDL